MDDSDEKYETQSDGEFHCGPIVIYNLLKSMNKFVSIDELNKICRPNMIIGTSYKKMLCALNLISKKYNIVIYEDDMCIKKINRTLKSGGKIILLFHWKMSNGISGEHYTLIESIIDRKYKMLNYNTDTKSELIDIVELEKILIHYRCIYYTCPKIWHCYHKKL